MSATNEAAAPGGWRPALVAGLAGGAAAGAADAVATVLGGGPGLRGVWLLLLALGLGGLAGALLAAVYRGLRAALSRVPRPEPALLAALLLAGPVVGYDALVLFAGNRAARLPGRHAISAVLVLLALGALALVGSRLLALVRAAERERTARRRAGLAALALVLWGVILALANHVLLPRLYPWFHNTLSLCELVAPVLAMRLVLAAPPSLPAPRPAALWLALLGAAGAVALGLPLVRKSQSLLFLAHERTQIAGLLLRALPLRAHPRPVSFAKRLPTSDQSDEPLPEGPHRADADVILVTIDALRADHVGAYGYPRATTPNLDALARTGTRFERVYAQAPHTSFSVASMLTGKYYPTLARLAPGDPHDPIALVLRRYGWKTAAFYPPAVFFVDGEKLKAYRENHFQFEYVKFEYLDAHARMSQLAEFFDTEKPRKAFVWIHFFEPHEPYEERPQHHFGPSDIDRYDSEIAYTDAALGRLLAYLKKTRPGAIVIVTADHGEEFDEHGGRYHGSTLYEEQIRVPLIVSIPGVPPHAVSGPVEVIDIAPTILGLLDIPVPVRMRGTDWAVAHVPARAAGALPPAFAELEDKRMVVWGTEKLICDLNYGFCAYHDLAADPRETQNLAEQRPDRVAALRQRLDDWLDDHVRFEPQLIRGLANPEGGAIPKSIERGRLGDITVAPELVAMLRGDETLSVRREAARLLVTALPRRRDTRDGLLAARGVADPEIRDWVAVAAARLGERSEQGRLREIVERTPPVASEELRIQAGLALAETGDPAATPALSATLDHCGSVVVCRLVIVALGKLKDSRATPALVAHLAEVQNRREMVIALGDIADPAAAGPLGERLKSDEYVPVRREAATALAKIKGSIARASLAWAVAHESEPSVLMEARAALARLDAETATAPPSPPGSSADTGRSPRRGRAR